MNKEPCSNTAALGREEYDQEKRDKAGEILRTEREEAVRELVMHEIESVSDSFKDAVHAAQGLSTGDYARIGAYLACIESTKEELKPTFCMDLGKLFANMILDELTKSAEEQVEG